MSKERFGANCVRPHFEETAKKENGITLLSLILTIIIMLILTGVALSIALGENGIVEKAYEAVEATQIATDREILLSAAIGAMGNNGKINLSAIVLPEGFTGSNGTYTCEDGHTFTVSEMGDIVYTGGSDSDEGTENVDLNGKYYYNIERKTAYYEIINNNTMIIMSDEEEMARMPLEIDYDKKVIAVTYEHEDGSSGEMITGTMLFCYDFVIENGEVVNKYIYFKDERNWNSLTKQKWI